MVTSVQKLLICSVLMVLYCCQATLGMEEGLTYGNNGRTSLHTAIFEEVNNPFVESGRATSPDMPLRRSSRKGIPSLWGVLKTGWIAAVVCLNAMPAAAAESITLGTQYQVTTTTPGAVYSNVAPTSTNGTAFGVWLDPSLNVVGGTLTSAAAGSIFTLSAAPTIASATPGIACSTTNPLCVAAWACGTNICVRPFNPFTGVLSAISNANTATSTNIGGGVAARFSDDTLGVAWASSSAGNYQVWQRTYSGSTGLALTNPLNVNLNPSVLQGTNCIVGLPTTPSTALMGWQGGSGANWNIYKAVINTASGTILSAAQMISTNTTQQQSINCFTSNGEGRLAWSRNTLEIRIQRIAQGGALIGSDYLLQGVTGSTIDVPVGVGTPDNNALIIVGQDPGGYGTLYGGTFAADATGTPQSAFVQIPLNPNSNGQGAGSLTLLGGGTPLNYTALMLFYGDPSVPSYTMQARAINVVGGQPTSSPTSGPAPTTQVPTTRAPTTSAPVSAPTTQAPTGSPISGPAPTTRAPSATLSPTSSPTTSAGYSLKASAIYTLPAQLISGVYGGLVNLWRGGVALSKSRFGVY